MSNCYPRPGGNRKPLEPKDTLENITGQTRGTLTARQHVGYCTNRGSAIWLFECSVCHQLSEVTRAQFLRRTIYPCPVCEPHGMVVFHAHRTPKQEKQLARLTLEERRIFDLVMGKRECTRANVQEALDEIPFGWENAVQYYAPRRFHIVPPSPSSALNFPIRVNNVL